MKKQDEFKYPGSANLFQFCKRVLDHKLGGMRVIDQDVGQILGFDPADCSHWKKGKKNVRSIYAMKSIAEHLGVDERLVVDVAAGELDDEEAFFEYNGYGGFSLDNKVLEFAKKEYYKKNASTWSRDKESAFKSKFNLNIEAIEKLVTEIHEKINFSEAPLYLPEIVMSVSSIKLVPVDNIEEVGGVKDGIVVSQEGEVIEIKYLKGREVRPHMRFKIAKEIGKVFMSQAGISPTSEELGEAATHIKEIQSNIFAAKLLVPINLLKKEIVKVNPNKDIVTQLAEIFWVSKIFMNQRLKNLLEKEL